MKNIFIALEGIDGSGKSTQAKLLAQHLEENGHKAYITFEPTDNYIGKIIREILKGHRKADHKVIAALFAADRLDHILNEEYGIIKKLSEGYVVITDRYYFSSYAYHGVHVDMDWVIELNKMVAQQLPPTLNLFIDVSPQQSMQRINTNRTSTELFETVENLQLTRTKYWEAFEKQSKHENIVTIDGNNTVEKIADKIWEAVRTLL